jgi:S-formylglutathione hydrolase
MAFKTISAQRCFNGVQHVVSHAAEQTDCEMRVSVYMPDVAGTRRIPVVYWLSGLTCTEENFTVKAGAQRMASALGIAVVAPDTSPRGVRCEGDDDRYDFGLGAGFYVDATQAPWRDHYRMYSYVVHELPTLIAQSFSGVDTQRASIMGHSMGGHGALTIALKNPDRYRSVSAFAPIVAPTQVPWGQKALTGYLGCDESAWADYDACLLVQSRGWAGPEILIDQGSDDTFLDKQLRPDLFAAACQAAGVPLQLRMQPGFDHSYFFIASFIEDHLRFHARVLGV